MKTILVPTDFKLENLKIIDSIVMSNKPDSVGIIFIHAFKISDSITDLLLLSRRSREYENVSDEFYTQLEVYKQQYSTAIQFIGIEYFYGGTVAAFKNFIETLQADCIVYDKAYTFSPINKYSIDPELLTKRCGCEVLAYDVHEFSKEEMLFNTKMPIQKSRVLLTSA